MRVVTSSITGSGTIGPIVVDSIQSPFNASLWVTVSGAPVYTVAVTPDNPQSAWATNYLTNAQWFNFNQSSNVVGVSANAYTLVSAPCQAFKVGVVAASSTDVVKVWWLQGIAGAN